MTSEENKNPETSENLDQEQTSIPAEDVAAAYEQSADPIDESNVEDFPEGVAEEASDEDGFAVLEKLREENAQLKDQALRALAEAENTRKRSERAQADATKFAVSGFAKDMLEVADNLRRAVEAVPEERAEDELIKNLVYGIEATQSVMLKNFEKHGIEKLAPENGKFDPNFHEVMFEADMPDKPAGEIIQLIEPGYTLNGRLLRAARVGVAKGGQTSVDEEI